MNAKRFLAVALAAALVTGLSFAQPQGGPGGRMAHERGKMHGNMTGLMKKLNLTDDQQKQLKDLRFQFQKQQVGEEAKLRTAQIELRELLTADSPDRAAIAKKVDQLSALRADGIMAKFDHWQAVKKILTPEQQKIWKESLQGHFRGFLGEGPEGPKMRLKLRMMKTVPPPEET